MGSWQGLKMPSNFETNVKIEENLQIQLTEVNSLESGRASVAVSGDAEVNAMMRGIGATQSKVTQATRVNETVKEKVCSETPTDDQIEKDNDDKMVGEYVDE